MSSKKQNGIQLEGKMAKRVQNVWNDSDNRLKTRLTV